jgi:uncharacterized integral membrane protein (TIGR00697 family)
MEVKKIEGWDKINYPTPMFVRMSIVYAVALVLSNVIAVKIWHIGNYIFLPAAVILFPIVYIVSDVMTEVYGMKLSLLAIRMNVVVNVLLVFVTWLATKLPPAIFSQNMQVGFQTIFHWTWRIVVASMIGYYLGDWSNSAVISRMKVLQKGKNFPWRAWVSTVVGEGIDTLCFITIAFAGTMPLKALLTMILAQYLFKISYEAVCLPITTRVTRWWKKKESFEVYDYTDDLIKTYRPL